MDYTADSVNNRINKTRRGQNGGGRGATDARRGNRSLLWIGVWIACSTVPVLPFAQPLWASALADTPYAYLMWIPVFAFFWAAWSLTRMQARDDDSELGVVMGLPLMLFTGVLFMSGMTIWSAAFIGNSAGLLLWPLWALAVAWVLFGVRVTGRLLRPLLYLLLGWPPIYSDIVNVTNPLLEDIAVRMSNTFAHAVSWIHAAPGYGVYLIFHGGSWNPVVISTVCSGSDSFLAMLILLPIILVLFEGTLVRKWILIGAAAVLAVAMNLMRLLILMVSDHYIGSNFTFGVLHPVLGMILFIIILGLLAIVGRSIGLRGKTVRELRINLRPGAVRSTIAGAGAVALTVLLWPIYQWGAGSFGAPVPVATSNLSTLMPHMPGYSRASLGLFNDSSILGPHSYCQAFAYTNPQGRYIMAEEWWTPNLRALQTYGVNNCLLFHGFKVLGTESFNIRPGVSARAFAVLLPPSRIHGPRDAYYDVSYLYSALYHGKHVYLRAEFMTPIQYGAKPNSPLTAAMPTALTDLFQSARVTAHQRAALTNMAALSPVQKSTMLDFQSFVRQFAATNMSVHA